MASVSFGSGSGSALRAGRRQVQRKVPSQRGTVAATAVAITGAAAVTVGNTIQLSATITPTDSTQTPVWTIDHANLATIDASTGAVTGVAAGAVVATATVGGVKATHNITVNAAA